MTFAVNKFNAEQLLADSLAVFSDIGINIEAARMRRFTIAHNSHNVTADDMKMSGNTHSILFTGRSIAHTFDPKYETALDGTDGMCYVFNNDGLRVTKSVAQVLNITGENGRRFQRIKATTVHEIGHGVLGLSHCTEPICLMQEAASAQMVQIGALPYTFCNSHLAILGK